MARKICLFISIFCLLIAIAGCKKSSQENSQSIDSSYCSIKETQSSLEEESLSTDSNITSEEIITDKEAQGFVYMTENDSAVIVRYVGQVLGETFTIPDTLDGNTVKEIRNGAFASLYTEEILELRLPSSLRFTTFDLFEAFPNLEEIHVYGDATEYLISHDGVLYSKDGWVIRYPKGRRDEEFCIPTNLGDIPIRTIGDRAFEGNKYIKSVDCCENVVSISRAAFKDCEQLTSVYAPSVIGVLDDSFENTPFFDEAQGFLTVGKVLVRYAGNEEVITEDMFPAEVERLGYYAFSNLSVREIYLPLKISTIYKNAFYRCSNLVKLRVSNRFLPRIPNDDEIFIELHDDFRAYCAKGEIDNVYAYGKENGWLKYIQLLNPIKTQVYFEIIDQTEEFYYWTTVVDLPAEKIEGKYVVGWYKKIDGVITDESLQETVWKSMEEEVVYTPKLVEFKTNGIIFYNGKDNSDENIVHAIAIDVGDSYRFDRYGYEINGVYTPFNSDLMDGGYIDGEWVEIASDDTRYQFVGWEHEEELYTEGVWTEQSTYVLSLKAVWRKIE